MKRLTPAENGNFELAPSPRFADISRAIRPGVLKYIQIQVLLIPKLEHPKGILTRRNISLFILGFVLVGLLQTFLNEWLL
jgi:hypothetical protein